MTEIPDPLAPPTPFDPERPHEGFHYPETFALFALVTRMGVPDAQVKVELVQGAPGELGVGIAVYTATGKPAVGLYGDDLPQTRGNALNASRIRAEIEADMARWNGLLLADREVFVDRSKSRRRAVQIAARLVAADIRFTQELPA